MWFQTSHWGRLRDACGSDHLRTDTRLKKMTLFGARHGGERNQRGLGLGCETSARGDFPRTRTYVNN